MIFKRLVGYLLIPLCCLLLSACGGGGGDGDAAVNPAPSSDWDQMVWDQGDWS